MEQNPGWKEHIPSYTFLLVIGAVWGGLELREKYLSKVPPKNESVAKASDPVAELKAHLAKVASEPLPYEPTGWLKNHTFEVTNLDVSKTNSLTAPYRATLQVKAVGRVNTGNNAIYTYLATLDYGDNGWKWDGNLRIWDDGEEMSQEFISNRSVNTSGPIVHDMFVQRFRLPGR